MNYHPPEGFTPAQKDAVLADANEVLVSAAAGSGKTRVLTERVIRHIAEGVELERLLVVTFTESAAAEMRERITSRLSETDALAHYAALLPIADISTIHAFCRKLIRENFQHLGIDPAFKIGDDAELALIKSITMNALFEEEYTLEENADFLDLVDVYGGKTGDGRLEDLVLKIHYFMDSDPFPAEAAQRYTAIFENTADIGTTPWATIAREELAHGLCGAAESLRLAIQICNTPGGPAKYADKLYEELEMIENLHHKVSPTIPNDSFFEGGSGETFFSKKISPEVLPFSDLYTAFSAISWGSLPRISAKEKDTLDVALLERVKRIRDKSVKGRVKNLMQGVFFAPAGKMADDLCALAPRIAALMRLGTRFAAAFAMEKRTRNILDFSDLEHFAIKILYPYGPENMMPADVAKYHEVLVDEYQDSNKIQDLILSAVSERKFMVGDVKQSIYRFRRANPEMFIEKYNNFSTKQSAHNAFLPPTIEIAEQLPNMVQNEDCARIDLSANFRSLPGVINGINSFFSQLMCRSVGDVEYDSNAALAPGRDEYLEVANPAAPQVFLEILDQSACENDSDTLENAAESDDDAAEPISNIIAETRMIADCIKEQFALGVRPSEIAIIARSISGIATEVITELKNQGIDAIADVKDGFFSRQEIITAMAFLRITDNPRQDIDLITVLTSPVYAFTSDELFEVSRAASEGDIYEKLIALAGGDSNTAGFVDGSLVDGLLAEASLLEDSTHDPPVANLLPSPTAQKVRKFLDDLANWRENAIFMPIGRFIGYIFDTTDYPAHVANMPDGAMCQANLRILTERAFEFEDTSLTGLFHFIRYIERLADSGGIAGAAEPALENDKVRLMTIHASKGLEFPVVICAFLAKKFNTDDERRPVILHAAHGLGPFYINTRERTRANTLARFALSRLTRRENLSEELRCLYVAMTRAENTLILTGRAKNLEAAKEKWLDHIGNQQDILPMHYRRSVGNYLDWIMPCLLRREKDAEGIVKIREWSGTFSEESKKSEEDGLPIALTSEDFTTETTETTQSAATVTAKDLKNNNSTEETLPKLFSPKNLPTYPSKLSITEIKRLYDITPDSSFFEGMDNHQSANRQTPSSAGQQATTFEPPGFIKEERGLTPARIGSALHRITEHMNFEKHTTCEKIEELITQLCNKNLLHPEDAAAIDREKIAYLANSPLGERLRAAAAAKKLYRETPFVLALPATQFYPAMPTEENIPIAHDHDEIVAKCDKFNQAQVPHNEKILVHGIIDCHFEEPDKNGNPQLILLDFKSDNIPHSITLSQWAKRHRAQLEIYAQALVAATNMKVADILLYSFSRNEAVSCV